MKFDKKVMESGVVAAFSLVLAFSALPAAGGSTEADLNSRNVELIAETAGKSYRNVVATKVKKQNQLVASSVEEKQPVELKLEEAVKEKQPAELKLEEAVKEKQPEQAKLEEAAKEEQPENAVQDIIEEEKQPEESMPEEKEEKAADYKKEEVAEDKDNKSKDKDAEEKKEVSPWDTKLMPQVEEYLNVRTQASEEAEPAGKLPKGASAEIVESGDEWTKIKSGSVEGYVKNEYCVTGQEAETLANELGTTYATAVTGGVRVRETASSEEGVTILDVLEEGGKIKVDKEAEAVDGWVCVKVGDAAGYVSAEYVNVELELGKAISVEEERAAIEAAEAERRAKEAAQSQSQGGGTQQKAAVAASYDDVTLLGALIQCEAGSECYEGQLAVGAVVMNRVRAGYAGSISGVIYQSGQFTPALNGTMAGVLASGVSGSCIQAAQQAISGVDNVNGATSFRSVSSGMQGIVIGNHVFF